ncbi:MAG TPA: UxaA family hydrolase, partial [Anaerolineae bacterium]
MTETVRAQALLMHPGDDVGLAAVDLAVGAAVEVGGFTVVLRQEIPFGHKFALRPIPAGAEVHKYGECIGRAIAPIAAGEHVHVHNVESLRGRGDLAQGDLSGDIVPERAGEPKALGSSVGKLSVAGPKSAALPPTFLGYRRRDGRAGVRNHVLVLSTVQCADGVVTRLGRELPEVIAVSHPWGCSQIGADMAQTRRVLAEFAGHPNVAATLLVGLGCETILAGELAEDLAGRGLNVRSLVIQDAGGNRAALAAGHAICRELLAEASRAAAEPIPLSELIVGVECGGSDSWSGITANPAVGAASDL